MPGAAPIEETVNSLLGNRRKDGRNYQSTRQKADFARNDYRPGRVTRPMLT
jgi:hypothetical protein